MTRDGKPARRGGYYALRTGEDCLVFSRENCINKLDKYIVHHAIDNSLVALVAAASVKPFQFYEMIETLDPAGPYLELFGRVHNRRRGWITAGDEAISYKKIRE